MEVAQKRLAKWFVAARWANGFLCPYCGHSHGWRTQRDHWVCGRCRSHVSATSGTMLHGVRDLDRFLLAAWWYCGHHGVRTEHVRRAFAPMSYKTAWQWCRKIRSLMRESERNPLDGRIEVAIADGPYPMILLAKHGRGGRIETVRAMARDEAAISSIHTKIAPGSYVITPSLIASSIAEYSELPILCCCRIDDAGPSTAARQVCDRLRHFLLCLGRSTMTPKEFALYLDEFSFRYNHRDETPWQMVHNIVMASFPTPQDFVVESRG